ncbi:MAG: MoxR family ATPase [Elusimicrobia bacterium]|nr:MoxR family ATPase [Candidatus Liberimonas magnetica]
MLLEKLGIYGWQEKDENLLLSSLLTGDPLLLIGSHGTAKTQVIYKLAESLAKKFIAYDASKALFEDVLGYPNIQLLKKGQVEYIPSTVTIWDKEFILIDELNRALPEMQSKWLEIIRSRKIMGISTKVKWVFSAMNFSSYAGAQQLDEALIGRFALFVYPPEVLKMSEEDRIKVLTHVNGDDALAISEWTSGKNCKTVTENDTRLTGEELSKILKKSGKHFVKLREHMSTLPVFLAKFSELVLKETNGTLSLDGRRLGFIYRNILANRAVELAKAGICGSASPALLDGAKYVIESSIPVGLNDASIKREEILHKFEVCFDLLSDYFKEDSEISRVNMIYELFTTTDVMRKAELLIKYDLSELAKTKAWNDMVNSEGDITLLAYSALQVEANRPGTVPKEMIESLSERINFSNLTSGSIPKLKNQQIDFVEEIEKLFSQETDLGKIVAYACIRDLVEKETLKPEDITATKARIQSEIETFNKLID